MRMFDMPTLQSTARAVKNGAKQREEVADTRFATAAATQHRTRGCFALARTRAARSPLSATVFSRRWATKWSNVARALRRDVLDELEQRRRRDPLLVAQHRCGAHVFVVAGQCLIDRHDDGKVVTSA